MSLLFPVITLTETEEEVAQAALSSPAVKKYLQKLASEQAQAIITSSPRPGAEAEEYLRKLASAQGRLESLQTLLSIQPADPLN